LKHGNTNEESGRYLLRGESRVSPHSVQGDTRFLWQKPGLTVDIVWKVSVINPKQLPRRYYHGMRTDRRRYEQILKIAKSVGLWRRIYETMAKINKKGRPSGKTGNVVYRKLNNKSITHILGKQKQTQIPKSR
jgi:hypothetical protein